MAVNAGGCEMGSWRAQSKDREGEIMKLCTMFAAAMMSLAGPVSAAQYEALANPPDPVAQRDELIALYDEICLRAFPDEAAAAAAAARHNGTPLSAGEVRRFLHDDPGIGWAVRGRTGRFHVTIERSPPYHSCAVRVMTAGGFADLGPYQAVADAYERGRGFQRIPAVDTDVGDLHIAGGGERRLGPGDSSESLLVVMTSASPAGRARGQTAIEVRFAHQYYGQADAAGAAKSGR